MSNQNKLALFLCLIIVAIVMVLIFSGCQKDLSQEGKCGRVVAKGGSQNSRTFDINYSGTIVTEKVGLLQFVAFNVGDTYCK